MKVPPWIEKAKTYTPGLSIEEIKKRYSLKQVYKLASNENPLPPHEGLLKTLTEKLKTINRYPSYIQPVIQAASQYYQVEASQVILGNGSSELIDKLMQVYSKSDSAVLISEKSFPLYELCAQTHNLTLYKTTMNEDLKVNIEEMLSTIKKNNNIRLVFISNPNNPTGSYITHSEVEKLLSITQNKNILLVLDEAYLEYVRTKDFPDGVSLLKKYPHLVILRTMSKVMGLAGLRAGVLLSHPSTVETMKKALCPFNVNILALEAMRYCFSNPSFKQYLSDSKELVWKSLDYFYNEFKKLNIKFYPSQGNFLLFSINQPDTFSSLLKKGLILRPMNEPGLENYLRMSIGLEEENKKALSLIQSIM